MKAVRTLNIHSTVAECYHADPGLLSIWHDPAHDTVEKCIMDCVADLKAAGPEFQFYRIHRDGKLLGFFGKEGATLVTFFIHEPFRNEKTAIWKFIVESFNGESFLIGIHTANGRAAKFLTKMGGSVQCLATNHKGQEGLVFRFQGVK